MTARDVVYGQKVRLTALYAGVPALARCAVTGDTSYFDLKKSGRVEPFEDC
jgi:hypothetical protein